MSYSRLVIAAVGVLLVAQSASAQVLGTFRWRTAPYCNVMNLTVTQVGSIYRLEGFEQQCGGNPNQPIWGIGIPQNNGTITFGLTYVPLPGTVRPTALRLTVNPADGFNGGWADRTETGTLEFNPQAVSGGPRTSWSVFDEPEGTPASTSDELAALRAEVEALKSALAALLAKKDEE
jgi:hypothetical protein